MDLHEYLEYKDGALYWKLSVNKRHARKGDRAGVTRPDLYRTVTLQGKKFLEHRLIFFLLKGYWPKFVDHINQDKTDNRIENLREVTPQQNSLNHRNNTKTPNICLHQGAFQLVIKGKYYGRFASLEEAESIRNMLLT